MYIGDNQAATEETLFWTEEVEAELNRWDEEKFKLAKVRMKALRVTKKGLNVLHS